MKEEAQEEKGEQEEIATSNSNSSSSPSPDTVVTSSSSCEEQPASSICETTTDDNNYDEDNFFAGVGFMFEGSQPVRLERFDWEIPASDNYDDDDNSNSNNNNSNNKRSITVALHVADDVPGAVQSGHYLWPAAAMLCDHLVQTQTSQTQTTQAGCSEKGGGVVSVVELGAGCALVSLTALQLWQDTLQCVCVTDHDPGTLERARDNLETTVQTLLGECEDDDHLNAAINGIVSIPVLFETLEWGEADAVTAIVQGAMQEHIVQGYYQSTLSVDVVLGSDLIYCSSVVEPLLKTAAQLMGTAGRFVLSQSFVYDAETEAEIDAVCLNLGLKRVILVDQDDGARRIQEFTMNSVATEVAPPLEGE
jgi:predicted nicotinamide N-methyase